MFSAPISTAPAAVRRWTAVASWAAGAASRRIFEPAMVVTPSTSNRFFTAKGTPASGPTGRSAARSASIASAWARARSAKTAV